MWSVHIYVRRNVSVIIKVLAYITEIAPRDARSYFLHVRILYWSQIKTLFVKLACNLVYNRKTE